jgi:hypothetical protein
MLLRMRTSHDSGTESGGRMLIKQKWPIAIDVLHCRSAGSKQNVQYTCVFFVEEILETISTEWFHGISVHISHQLL